VPGVLSLGLDPLLIDPESMSGMSPVLVRAFSDSRLHRVRSLGNKVESCLAGAGLHAPKQLLRLEKLLDEVHAGSQGAGIRFNTARADSAEAVQRRV